MFSQKRVLKLDSNVRVVCLTWNFRIKFSDDCVFVQHICVIYIRCRSRIIMRGSKAQNALIGLLEGTRAWDTCMDVHSWKDERGFKYLRKTSETSLYKLWHIVTILTSIPTFLIGDWHMSHMNIYCTWKIRALE